jgi:glycine cleavage system H protein
MYPSDLKYTKTHEWIRLEGKTASVGITSFAIEELTDLTYLQISTQPGKSLKKGDVFGVVESVKGTSDLYMPVSGKIVAVHTELSSKLEELMKDSYKTGWLVKLEPSNSKECDTLLAASDYEKHCQESHH